MPTKCDICGRPVPEDEVIVFEGRSVCAVCKPAFIQQLKEGVLEPVPPAPPDRFGERELGFGELLATTWQAFARDWPVITVLTLLVALPVNFFLAAVDPGDEPTMRELGRYLRVAWNLETVIGVFAVLGIAHVVNERLQGRGVSLGGALAHAVRRYLAGLGTGVLASLIVGLFTLALIVPGIIWFNYYSFAICVASLRGCAGMSALRRSKDMVKGRWWSVAWKLAALTVVTMVPASIVLILYAFAPESPVLSFATDVAFDLFSCFGVVGTTVLFLNLEAVGPRSY